MESKRRECVILFGLTIAAVAKARRALRDLAFSLAVNGVIIVVEVEMGGRGREGVSKILLMKITPNAVERSVVVKPTVTITANFINSFGDSIMPIGSVIKEGTKKRASQRVVRVFEPGIRNSEAEAASFGLVLSNIINDEKRKMHIASGAGKGIASLEKSWVDPMVMPMYERVERGGCAGHFANDGGGGVGGLVSLIEAVPCRAEHLANNGGEGLGAITFEKLAILVSLVFVKVINALAEYMHNTTLQNILGNITRGFSCDYALCDYAFKFSKIS